MSRTKYDFLKNIDKMKDVYQTAVLEAYNSGVYPKGSLKPASKISWNDLVKAEEMHLNQDALDRAEEAHSARQFWCMELLESAFDTGVITEPQYWSLLIKSKLNGGFILVEDKLYKRLVRINV